VEMQGKWRRRRRLEADQDGTNAILHTYKVVDGLAARLDEPALSDVLGSNDVASVSPNCVIQLGPGDNPEPTRWNVSRTRAAPAMDEIHRQSFRNGGSQAQPPWNLDRIDSRVGLDGTYTYGVATGRHAVVYVLDTGVRVSHSEFGGRALPGWSAGCREIDPTSCTSGWSHLGVAGAGCSGHGTHCASSVAGTTFGVAKESVVVSVQVLSCSGTGSDATVIAGIDWAVQQATREDEPPSIISVHRPPLSFARTYTHGSLASPLGAC
jgi:subtilisin family serine protease